MSLSSSLKPWRVAVPGLLFAMTFAGCSSGGLPGVYVANYQAANAIMPIGHSYTLVGERHYKVSAAGTAQTPRERVEKIATARAAEIGVEQKLPYFKIANASHGVSCREKKKNAKVGDLPAAAYPTVTLDVLYSKTADDASFQRAADAFTQLKGELDAEVVTPETAAATASATNAQCGAT